MATGGDGAPLGTARPERFRFGEVDVCEVGFVAFGVFKVVMRGFVVGHEEEGFFLVPVFL